MNSCVYFKERFSFSTPNIPKRKIFRSKRRFFSSRFQRSVKELESEEEFKRKTFVEFSRSTLSLSQNKYLVGEDIFFKFRKRGINEDVFEEWEIVFFKFLVFFIVFTLLISNKQVKLIKNIYIPMPLNSSSAFYSIQLNFKVSLLSKSRNVLLMK